MNEDFELLISTFLTTGVGISDHFLSKILSIQLNSEILRLSTSKLLKPAGIGHLEGLQLNGTIRGDEIYWLDHSHENKIESTFLELMESFVIYLNMSCYTGITGFEFHYSFYKTGSFYKKHLDQFHDNSSRKYSIISYLNADWVDGDGGELIIQLKPENQIISPIQGKTVFFKSNELVHEVLLTHQNRLSVTGWLKVG